MCLVLICKVNWLETIFQPQLACQNLQKPARARFCVSSVVRVVRHSGPLTSVQAGQWAYSIELKVTQGLIVDYYCFSVVDEWSIMSTLSIIKSLLNLFNVSYLSQLGYKQLHAYLLQCLIVRGPCFDGDKGLKMFHMCLYIPETDGSFEIRIS